MEHYSLYVWAKASACFIHDLSVGMHRHGNHVFLHRDGVVEIPFAIQKLSKPGHHVVRNYFLCVQLCFKDHIPLAIIITIAHDGHRPLAKSGDVNTEAVPKVG